jgi:hypothetical protein
MNPNMKSFVYAFITFKSMRSKQIFIEEFKDFESFLQRSIF